MEGVCLHLVCLLYVFLVVGEKSNVSKPQLEDNNRLQVYGHTAIVKAAFSRFL